MIITDAVTGKKTSTLEPVKILSNGQWVEESGSDYGERRQEELRRQYAVQNNKAWPFEC